MSRFHRKFFPSLTLSAGTLFLAGAGSAQTIFHQSGAPLLVTVPPDAPSAVSFQTAANDQCSIWPEGADTSVDGLPVFADDDGIAVFDVQPRQDWEQIVASCSSGFKQIFAVHSVEGAKPLVAQRSSASKRTRYVRPALTGDPLQYSDEELQQQGYPSRPDPQQAPAAYAVWLQLVSQPATFIPPKLVTRPSHFHGPAMATARYNGTASSINWSGYAVTLPFGNSNPFYWVVGGWKVPSIIGTGSNALGVASVWVGMDGYQFFGGVLVQDGTDSYKLKSVSSSSAWTEMYPSPPVFISNFPIHPGDAVFAWTSITNGTSGTPYGHLVNFYIYNQTTGAYTQTTPQLPGPFFGYDAEWVVERPWNGDQYALLPDYGTAVLNTPQAFRGDGSLVTYRGASGIPSIQITMQDLDTLSTATATDSNDITFKWLHSQ